MTSLARAVLPLAALAAAATLLAGCSGSGSTSSAASSPASPASPSVASAAATITLTATAQPAPPSTAPPATASPDVAATASAAPPVVYLAEGGSVTGTIEHAPACRADCAISGDSSVFLSDMTWSTWTSAEAVGAGTEKLDDCNPNCAAGTIHSVAVDVTLSKPVLVCLSGQGTWFWTRLTFRWPNGLPAVFSGDDAPANPFIYDGIAAQAAKSCK
jgi:hypothetical protein